MACAAPSALADTTDSSQDIAGQSSASSSEVSPLSLDRFYLGYYGNLEGSKVDQLGTPYAVDSKGNQTSGSAMTFASDVTAAYMLTPTIGVGTYLEMNLTPVLGDGATFLDVGVTTFNLKLISTNGLTVFGNAIVEAPTDTYDLARGMVAGFETTPYIRYDVPGSRFTVGAWTEVKNYAGSNYGKLIKTYWEPYVSYPILPKVSANLSYELEYDKFAGISGFSVYESDFQPGFNFNVAPRVLINPYVQFFTNNRLTYDTMAFGANVVARVL